MPDGVQQQGRKGEAMMGWESATGQRPSDFQRKAPQSLGYKIIRLFTGFSRPGNDRRNRRAGFSRTSFIVRSPVSV